MILSRYEQVLLAGWEDTSKKSQLTLWILLALKESPKHMGDIRSFLHTATDGLVSADDKSIYRALRRFNDAQLVDFVTEKNERGPDKKVYNLSEIGEKVLNSYTDRNIKGLFFSAKNKHLFT